MKVYTCLVKMWFRLTILKLAFVTLAWGQTEPKVRLVYPDEWLGSNEATGLSKEMYVLGVYECPDKSKQRFKVKSFQLKDTLIDDGAYGLSRRLIIDSIKPLFLASGLKIKNGTEIAGMNLSGVGIYPGKTITYVIGTKHYTIFSNGKFVVNSEGNISSISNYEVVLRMTENEKAREQVVYKVDKVNGWDAGGFEGGVKLRWIGDLNNDNSIGIILTTSDDYRSWKVILLMTSQRPDQLVDEVYGYSRSAP